MMGLRILLEAQKNINRDPQIINKVTINNNSFSPTNSSPYSQSTLPAVTFLDSCFLCKQRILPGKDIYMYQVDRAFCSVECRYRRIFMDEKSVESKNCCSSAAMNIKVIPTSTRSPAVSSYRHSHRNGTRTRQVDSTH